MQISYNRMTRPLTAGAVASLLVGLLVSPVMAGYSFDGGSAEDFTYLYGSKWDPGSNTASFHGFSPPNGPYLPGGATFSVMGAGLGDSSGLDSKHGTYLTADVTALGVPTYTAPDYALDFNATMDIWASVSGFTNLGQVADGGVNAGAPQASGGHLGDIRFAAWELTASTTLAHGYAPGTEGMYGLGGTILGDIHFDVDRNWVDDPFDVSGNGNFDLFTVALHELGHALGLGHSNVTGSVMEPVYAGARRTLQADDIDGIQALYSVPEPATLGLLLLGSLALIRPRRR